MTVYAWPQTALYTPAELKLMVVQNQVSSKSLLSKYTQVLSRPGAQWGWDIQLSDVNPDELAQVEAYITRLNGKEHWITFFDWLRPVPRGTINLSGVTTSGTISQFATTATLTGCGTSKTLLAGDWLQLGTQLVMNVVDATSDGAGLMTIEFRHMARSQIAGGSSVVLDRPVSNYIVAESNFESARQSGYAQPGPVLRLEEIF